MPPAPPTDDDPRHAPHAVAAPGAYARDRHLLGLLDLTLLDAQADAAALERVCRQAANRHGPPAALCLWPRHVAPARERLAIAGLLPLPIATVANFPEGSSDPGRIVRDIEAALAAGADEIDAVIPWQALRDGDVGRCASLLALMRERCQGVVLKLILETGMLDTPARIAQASRLAIDAGADFIKTSTGKVPVNATPQAARIMLQAIADSGTRCGFKAAGGIRTPAHAQGYVELAEQLLGSEAVAPQRLRIGASALMDALLARLDAAATGSMDSGGAKDSGAIDFATGSGDGPPS